MWPFNYFKRKKEEILEKKTSRGTSSTSIKKRKV